MNKLQLLVVALAVFVFAGLYFGVPTKPANYAEVEKTRMMTAEATDIGSLLVEAKPKLDKKQSAFIMSLEQQASEAASDSMRIAVYKNLASHWYSYNRADISGYYAEKVAEKEQSEEAWSIAGTTYMIGARQSEADKIKRFCSSRAASAFENAISINPENVNHKVNLATCFAENPPQDNPMKGVMMLLDLVKTNPDSVPVLVALGRFGIETGQYEKAVQRLSRAVELDSAHKRAHCLLATALENLGKTEDAVKAQKKCAMLQ